MVDGTSRKLCALLGAISMTDRLKYAEHLFEQIKRPHRCLLVDDDDPLRESLAMGFEGSAEVELHLAAHGEEALQKLNDGERFDCILLDLNLGAGHMDGVDIFKHIKNIDKEAHVAFLTGWPEDMRFSEATKYGWFTVYSKPIDFDDLKSLIGSLAKRELADARH